MSIKHILLAALVFAAGCAHGPSARDLAERQAAYHAAAGAPVTSFRFFTPLWSWEPLGSDEVVIYTRPKQAWLLDVPGCSELPFANVIGLTSNMDQVSVHFDKVLPGRGFVACAIQQIRPIDLGRLKAVQQEQRQIETRPRPAGT